MGISGTTLLRHGLQSYSLNPTSHPSRTAMKCVCVGGEPSRFQCGLQHSHVDRGHASVFRGQRIDSQQRCAQTGPLCMGHWCPFGFYPLGKLPWEEQTSSPGAAVGGGASPPTSSVTPLACMLPSVQSYSILCSHWGFDNSLPFFCNCRIIKYFNFKVSNFLLHT